MKEKKVKVTIHQQITIEESGELVSDEILYESKAIAPGLLQKERSNKPGDYMLAVQLKMRDIANDPDFRGNDFRVYLNLLSMLHWDGFVTVNQSELARSTGMSRTAVSRAMKLLTRKNVLIEGTKKGTLMGYQLNAQYGYKGDAKKMAVVAKQQQRKHLRVV